jgi:hypothetical protein
MNPGGLAPGARADSGPRRPNGPIASVASTLKPFRGGVATGAVILVLSAALAWAVVWNPRAGLAAVAGLAVLLVARCAPKSVETLFLRLLVIVLLGYALLGRTFAGIGAPPLYVGELVLGVGLLSAIAAGWHSRPVRSPLIYLLIAFMGWGAARTIPYLGTYGLNAVRDGVVWGYGIFALLLAPLLIRRDLVGRIPALYARVLPWIVVCAPAWVIISVWTGLRGIPGTSMGDGPKPGDVAVHLGGAAAFILAMTSHRAYAGRGARRLAEWAVWPALLIGLVAMGSLNRGGLVAALAAILTVMILLPFKAAKKLVLAGAMAVLVASLWLGWGEALPGRESRPISPEQIVRNLGSIGGGSWGGDLEDTRVWRLLWWNSIIDYTVHGQYFWTGKGFGVNLSYDDGILRDPEARSRSPHNGHLTILARAGVPGLALWTLLQLGFALSVLAGMVRARQAGQETRAALFIWILAYWLAFLLNVSFDVYLEGPQGGIWFWCIFGYGLALLASQSRQIPWRPRVSALSAARRVQNLTSSRGL